MKANYEEYFFSGRNGFPVVWQNDPADRGPIGLNGENIVDVRGRPVDIYISDDLQNLPPSLYIHGSQNYDGLRRLFTIVGSRNYQFYAPYVAENFVGVEVGAGFKSSDPHEFGGFSVRIASASGSSRILEVKIHSAKGTFWDSLLYSQDTYNVTDINHMFGEPIPLLSNDRLEVTLASSAIVVSVRLLIRKV